uniref:Uncharacterized protein n=1 Tax=Oryza glumipatula TaxID=40148 RepID=A0A0E0AF65_9ORYZ
MKGSEGKGTESSGFNRRRSASVWGPHGLIWAVRFGRPVGLTGEPIADAGQQAAGSQARSEQRLSGGDPWTAHVWTTPLAIVVRKGDACGCSSRRRVGVAGVGVHVQYWQQQHPSCAQRIKARAAIILYIWGNQWEP